MSASRKLPAFASDDWMLAQQLRAELEADAWRRLREERLEDFAVAPAPPPERPARDSTRLALIERGGSAVLKALVRFAFAAACAYLAWLAAVDATLGEFETWLAAGAGFFSALSISMFEPVRRFVHAAAEALRWCLLLGAALGAAWLLLHMSA